MGSEDPRVIAPHVVEDERGFFSETYRRDVFEREVGPFDFVQDNQSLSKQAGTVRGLHFQLPPVAQGKLVRVTKGAILDVAVDIRQGSPGFGRVFLQEVSAANRLQFWVPPGFAHGFCTTEPDTEVLYKVTAFYSPAHDRGIAWDDPDLAIPWPVAAEKAILSDKDRRWPRLSALAPAFRHGTEASGALALCAR
jgi:dTDP-4-dehydrorhamnose 3,5-epimerase